MAVVESHADRAGAARAHLVAVLLKDGVLRSPEWVEAFGAVPREVFVPRFFRRDDVGGWTAVDRSDPRGVQSGVSWVSESVLPSGSVNQAMRAPPGAVQAPRSSWAMPA